MKIEKDKPLPDHTKLDYYECYAKIVLEDLFPDRYFNLILADKPDLQGYDVGIEVTKANGKNREELEGCWVTANNCSNWAKACRCVDRMKQLGAEYNRAVQSWPVCRHSSAE